MSRSSEVSYACRFQITKIKLCFLLHNVHDTPFLFMKRIQLLLKSLDDAKKLFILFDLINYLKL